MGGPEPDDLAETLLPLALSQPTRALARAREVLRGTPTPYDVSVAHQAAGIVLRERGDHPGALTELRAARRAARQVGGRSGSAREGDVLATYGVTLAQAGRPRAALRALDEAQARTPASARPRLLLRRAFVRHELGRHAEALADAGAAAAGSALAGDRLWQARALNLRATVHLALGATAPAAHDAREAQRLLQAQGQDLEAAAAVLNQGYAALVAGDLPGALALLDEVAHRYRELGEDPPEVALDRAEVLLVAGLGREAADAVRDLLTALPRSSPVRPDALLLAARAALAVGDARAARRAAGDAARGLRARGRVTALARARLLRLEADEAVLLSTGAARARWARLAAEAAGLLLPAGPGGTADALLLRARAATRAGLAVEAHDALRAAAATRADGPPLPRAAGWLATALLAREQGDRRGLRRAVRSGLAAIDEHRETLGDLELRALAGGRGEELARLGAADALAHGRPLDLLRWAERWRGTALTAATPPADPALAAHAAALRDVARRLGAADEAEAVVLRREQARLEGAVRRHHRRLRGAATRAADGTQRALAALVEQDVTLLHLVEVEGVLHLVTRERGRWRRRAVGPLADALTATGAAAFALRRAAHGRAVDPVAVGTRLQAAVLAEGVEPGSDRVLVVPPAPLLSVPWSLLPALTDHAVSVSPSLAAWDRARRRPDEPGPTALVTGPGLSTRQSEATLVEGLHVGATALAGPAATVDATLAALDGARLAHVAAHGRLRRDAPLFSALELADGPLHVHDLQRLRRAPAELVLSACESAGLTAVGAGEALGLVTTLLGLGTRTVVASVAEVNDRATVTVMARLHAAVAAGAGPALALRDARAASRDDPLDAATAAAFTAWGA